jgi:C4-dicarboxylate transporter/malic acid transport protein
MTALKHFTPNWYTTTMGTGILALMLNQFPLAIPGVPDIARALWLVNIALFALLVAASVAQFIFFREESKNTLTHPVQSMFYGAVPMGFATIVNGFVVFGPSLIGIHAYDIATVLWWMDAVLAVVSGWLIPFTMFTQQKHSLETMSALWLLPIVPSEVTAASGGLLAPHLAIHSAQIVLGTSSILWAFSVPLALAVLALLYLRLALHRVPPSEVGVSTWLTLGPLATGALGTVLIGNAAAHAFAGTSLAPVGAIAQALGIITGAVLWGYGAWWWPMAIFATLHHLKSGLPFNLGWWGFTFPLGVFSAATLALARATSAHVLTMTGAVLIALLAALWIVCAARTVICLMRGELFPRTLPAASAQVLQQAA